MMMTTEERVALLEQRLTYYDGIVRRLTEFARLTPGGRAMLKALGLR